MKFLIIDDDPEYRALLRHHISVQWPDAQFGEFDPRTQAMEELKRAGAYSVILLDYQLGPIDGLTLLHSLRKLAPCPPIIMITGTGNERLAVDAIRGGAADYIPKAGLTNNIITAAIAQATGINPLARSDARPRPKPRQVGLKQIGNYTLLKQAGLGAQGYVYKAQDPAGRLVAMKLVPLAKGSKRHHEMLKQAVAEIAAVHRLNSHRIPKLIDHGQSNGFAYLCMEWLGGGSIKSKFANRPLPNHASALQLCREIAAALADLHRAGLVHRDLKPENVMLREDGSIVLIDFGTVGRLAQGEELVKGTPYYLSPEQIRGEKLDGRSDLYALGCILHELLTGLPPFRARSIAGIGYKHLHAEVPQLMGPAQFAQGVLNRLLAKTRSARFADATAAAQALDLVAEMSRAGVQHAS